jgi:GNAT superfamily N-acetyltransferase
MTARAWHEEPVAKKHDRKAFDRGHEDLNRFLQQYPRQAHEHGASKTYVAVDDADATTILGYYTLSPAQVDFYRVPEAARLNLGRHDVGGFRLARLAVSKSLQGQGLGGQFLVAAARRCMWASQEVGGTALMIDAKRREGGAMVRLLWSSSSERRASLFAASLWSAHGGAAEGGKRRGVVREETARPLKAV